MQALAEVERRFNSQIPLLDPVKDMKIEVCEVLIIHCKYPIYYTSNLLFINMRRMNG
jgi:hypothetical protein